MEILDALAWAGQFTLALRASLRLWKAVQARDGLSPGEREQVKFIRGWLWMVQQDRLVYGLCGDSRDLLDDYRFWKDRDGPLVPQAVAARRRIHPYN